ncbi:hypothetical protein HZS_1767, partial [Henneguya salminicola]
WGITNITFIDDGRVSYSNPPRQSLYNIIDCDNKDLGKAHLAAKALNRIYPHVNSKGINIRIPEPDHPIMEQGVKKMNEKLDIEKMKTLLSKIESVFEEHDVVFLLTDSRESRWLPTLLCESKNKLAICSAIGAESFLVMRHSYIGPNVSISDDLNISSDYLGCYFCSDISCPSNSQINKTMDLKCSVTRPGISMMAAAHSVELLISLIQHPRGFCASAPISYKDIDAETERSFGIVPHQIRYFQSSYTTMLSTIPKFKRCSACSIHILEEFEKRGYDFVIDVCNNSNTLAKVSKILELVISMEPPIDMLHF